MKSTFFKMSQHMSEFIHNLAKKAGIVKNEDHTLRAERHGCRGYIANLAELTEFARLVGKIARDDERSKLSPSTRRDDTSE